MELKAPKQFLTTSGALVVAAIAGGAVAIAGAAAFGVGDSTTTVREVVRDTLPGNQAVAAEASTRGGALSIADIYLRAAPGVVQVTSTTTVKLPPSPFFDPYGLPDTQTQRALGSGFVIDKAGYIVTNYHVVRGADSVHVSFSNNDSLSAKIVGRDPSTDLALLKVSANSRALQVLELGDSDRVQVGDDVLAIGNPFGLARSATRGIISAIQRPLQAPDNSTIDHVLQTDAPINHGNSGGPLLNVQGQVIGVNSAIETGGSGSEGNVGIGFAIPANTVRDVVAQLKEKGRVEHPFLGISAIPISPSMAKDFRLPVEHGLLIERVFAGSGAAEAGLMAGTTSMVVSGESYTLGGDVLVKVDGQEVTSTEELRGIIAHRKPGDTIEVEYLRGQERKTADIKLGRQPPPPQE